MKSQFSMPIRSLSRKSLHNLNIFSLIYFSSPDSFAMKVQKKLHFEKMEAKRRDIVIVFLHAPHDSHAGRDIFHYPETSPEVGEKCLATLLYFSFFSFAGGF
jgi:hypothetical protein